MQMSWLLFQLLFHYIDMNHVVASFPGPTQLSVACRTKKCGEPDIFSHMSIT